MVKPDVYMNSKIRVKIQELIESNTSHSGGDFHIDELDEYGLICDICKNLKLIPREPGANLTEALNDVINRSTKKVRGMINSKELKQNIFLKRIHETFEIQSI